MVTVSSIGEFGRGFASADATFVLECPCAAMYRSPLSEGAPVYIALARALLI